MSKKNIHEILPLSPVQQGMLFHTLYDPESTAYIEQYGFPVGDIDPDVFAQTLQVLVDRNPVLRTAFVWRNLRSPVQVVYKSGTVTLPIQREDWSDLPDDERTARMAAFRLDERVQGFDLTTVPVIRVGLVRMEPNVWWTVWTYHHMILDGWSVGLMSRELQQIALGITTGTEPKLPPPRPFGDFIRWYQKQDLDVARSYWQETLAGFDEPTPLGIDRPAEGARAPKGDRYYNINRNLPTATGSAAKALSRSQHITMPTLVQAAWALVLSRYSGRNDLVYGLTVSGRPHDLPGVQRMLGCFINTLPMRVSTDAGLRVTDWLTSVQDAMRGLQPFEHSPLAELRGWTGLPADRPIFDSIVVYEGFGSETAESGAQLAYRTNYAVAIGALPTAESITFAVGTDRRRISDAAADRLLDHLESAFTWLVNHPSATLGAFVLTNADTQQRREAWQAQASDYARDRPLTALLDDVAAEAAIKTTSEATKDVATEAVAALYRPTEGDEQRLTYAELTDASRRLARHLRDHGVRPEVRVGICVERGLDLLIATLGVMRAGGTYVPLDPDYPAERIRHVLDDAAVGALITHEALVPRLPAPSPDVALVLLDTERNAIDQLSAEPLDMPADATNLAYVIYTSGSTGKPKGVQIPHRPLVNFLESMAKAPGFGTDDTLVAVTTLAFDIAGLELYLPLLVGGRVVIADRETAIDGRRLATLLDDVGATVMQATPATWRLLLDSGWSGRTGLKVLCGGEALPRELADRLLALDLELWNLYGPTETTIWSTTTQVEVEAAAVSIGQPIANTQVHIVDHAGHPVATGVAGELLIGGDGLARGYAGRPDLTAERFVPDAFTGRAGRRVYRTGDLARWRDDGNIDYIGRADQQVKIRGYRIELGEIESVLADQPGIGHNAVVVRTESEGDHRLVAYWVGDPDVESVPTPDRLRTAVAETLPNYMVPSVFARLDVLPLTPNGKVDRGALARLPLAEAELGDDDGPPLSPMEDLIADLWREILGRSRVTTHDDFFSLGGHSLLATSLAARLRKVFDVDVPLRELFEAPTIQGMAARVASAQRAGETPPPPMEPAPADVAPQLSFAQERLWFLDKLQPGNPWYNIPAAVRLRGALDREAFTTVLGDIVERHQVLRTRFREDDGRPVADVAPPAPFDLPVVDLSSLDEDEQTAAVREHTSSEVATPFDLTDDLLIRAQLLRCADDDHVLVLTMHHIASDEWSMGVLVREIALGYGARTAGREATLPTLPIQYADFAHWQRGWLSGEVLDKQIAYWREQLTGAPALLELPTDRPRPRTPTFRGGTETAMVPAEVAEPLRTLGRKHGATTFMTALAAFAVVLGRYAGQQDVVIGTPTANRGRVELEPLIGFFVNTLALRIRFDDDPTFPELVARARTALLGAHAAQDLPFEQLVQALQPERSLSHAPLFQVMLVMQNARQETPPPVGDLTVEPLPASAGTSKFDLTLTVSDNGEGALGTRLVYASDLFTDTTAQRMLSHVGHFLAEVAKAPDRPVSAIPTLGEDERALILGTWNQLPQDFERASLLHPLIARQAQATPDAPAVLHEGGIVTHGELDRAANQLAHHLRAQGVGPETIVGIALERSPSLIIAMVAILKAGGAYLPLDPEYPEERLAFMLDDAAAPLVLTSTVLKDKIPATSARLLVLDQETEAVAAQPTTAPDVPMDGDHPVYVIYTSGSTGTPKGVMLPHSAVANRIDWGRQVDFDVPPRFLQKTSICFDVSVAEIFAPLVAGGCVVLPKPGGTKDTGYLVDLIERGEVTHTSFPPSLLGALLDEPSFLRQARSLRSVVAGGEAVPADLPKRFYAKMPSALLENRYGPTEATIAVTSWRCPNDPERFDDPELPIGLPIGEAEVYVVDRRGEPVPVGVPGEIMAGGGCLARGYLGRPALNAAAFVPHPFSDQPGARLYRTGDLGRWRDDGALMFIGRVDQQVQIRGFRVELGEIDAALLRHPSVREAAVIDVVDGDTRRLAAYVAPESGTNIDVDALRIALNDDLPEHMVPSAWTVLDVLPKSATGKIDRKALPKATFATTEAALVAPRTPTETQLAGIWSDVLDRDEVSVTTSFFDLGGHSLNATRVVSRLRHAFDVEMPLRALFETPTIAGLATLIDAQRGEHAAAVAAPPLVPRSDTDRADAPLSFAQERLWFLDRLEPGSPGYNLPVAVRFGGPLDTERLKRGLEIIVHRHTALRTTFTHAGGRPRQVIADPTPVPLPIIDLDLATQDDPDQALLQAVRAQTRKPFDLTRGPLVHATLLRLAGDDHVAVLSTHHIVSDGWSMGVFVRELAALYTALGDGDAQNQGSAAVIERADLPALPIQYADYAHWQRGWLRGDTLEGQIDYWRQTLAGAPAVLELPTDRPRPALQTFDGATTGRVLPASTIDGLRAVAREHGATLFMTLLAGFAAQMARYSGQSDVVMGTPIAGRNRLETENLIGLFVNALVLRLPLDPDATFADTVIQARDATLGAYAHQDVPFEKLVAELSPERDLSHPPLFQVMLVLQNVPPAAFDQPELTIRPVAGGTGTAKYDLTLTLIEGGDSLAAQLEYNTDLFDATTAERMLAELDVLLAGAAADPTQPWDRLPLLDQTALETRDAWNATDVAYPHDRPLPDLLRDMAGRRADEVAAVFRDTEVTYRELDDATDHVAAHLRAVGVGPETRVGICVDRSLDLLYATLGVLKAGGAYVPLDPAYPADRIGYVLEDASVAALLTQEALLDALPTLDDRVAVIGLDRDRDAIDATPVPDDVRATVLDPEHLAYVIYTSGSTGRPKGVQIPHRPLVNFLNSMASTPGFGADDRLVAVTTLSFDIAGLELYLPLLTGGRVIVADRETTLNGPRLAALIDDSGATAVQATPATWRLLLETGWTGRPGLRALCGGEALPRELAQRLLDVGVSLWNLYGPTETTIWSTVAEIEPAATDAPISIGRPIANTQVHLLDRRGQSVPVGVAGELLIGGDGLARGYFARPAMTAERFVPDPFATEAGQRLYRTGDLARWRPNGTLEYLGRLDHQVKVRGFRIELGEIEAVLARQSGVAQAVTVVHEPAPGDRRLVAYVVPDAEVASDLAAATLRAALAETLPDYMLPSAFVPLDALPLTPNGKVDRGALSARPLGQAKDANVTTEARPATPPGNDVERAIAAAWQAVLDVETVAAEDNFFDLGGHSLLLAQVHVQLRETVDPDLSMIDLFRFPTVRALARHLGADDTATTGAQGIDVETRVAARRVGQRKTDIAIIGMNGRFPGAQDIEGLWHNLRDGVESVTFHSRETLLEAGLPAAQIDHPNFVPANVQLPHIDQFDAAFFDYAPREAQVIDPQQRIFLEIAWEALERAGYDTARYRDRIAVFAGVGSNTYQFNLLSHPGLLETVGRFETTISNDKDFLPTRVSYKLDLRGPSINVQTACSTSLVATSLACDALVEHRTDMALAGGVTVRVNAMRPGGYLYEEGGIASRDGHTRSFDAHGKGTLPGNGAGIVVLKRLDDALRDGDHVHAVIKGWALNNDGADKIGWTAPSVTGQAEVIREALAAAQVDPRSIGYVEAHGTATPLGDPIEVEALTLAFGLDDTRDHCALGSVKSNFGHLDTAAGVTGLIKAVMALEQQAIPPSLHVDTPNPKAPFDDGPFFVNTSLTPWTKGVDGQPRRAGVSSLGIGGTNAHLVLEEAPARPEPAEAEPWQLIVLSAKTATALDTATGNLARHLEAHPGRNLADVAYTLQVGRRPMPFRRALVARDLDDAVALLDAPTDERVMSAKQGGDQRPVVFLFPGGGAQYRRMGHDLYIAEPSFRADIDRCAALFEPHLGFDVAATLFTADASPDADEADARLRRTSYALPTLFAIEYAVARLLMTKGIVPRAMIGHSLGEYAAAALAGALTLDDAVRLVAARAKLFETLDEGTMLSVALPVDDLMPLLGDDLAIAAVNTPDLCVASGPVAAIEDLAATLDEKDIENTRIHIDVAAHSPMVEPILEAFGAEAAGIEPGTPSIPYLSNVTGTWITAEDVAAPDYWPRHLRGTVRFAEGLGALFADEPDVVLLEIGPGKTLSTLARQHPDRPEATAVRTSMRHPREARSDVAFLRETLGRLWLDGLSIDWQAAADGDRRRVILPTYPFERQRYWIDRHVSTAQPTSNDTDQVSTGGPMSSPLLSAVVRPTDQDADLDTFVAPRTTAEQNIAGVWQEMLGIERIGIHDDFFDLGGSSLMAVRIGTRLRDVFPDGAEAITPHFLLEAPTVARLATRLAPDETASPEAASPKTVGPDRDDSQDSDAPEVDPTPCVVPLQPGRTGRTPLFLVHPVGGHVYFYRGLAAALGRDLPVFGLRALGLEDGETPFDDIVAMAAFYVEQVRVHQPHGPYRLGGSSMGGMIAYEMAQQLRAAGEDVALLALLDTGGPGQMPKRPDDDAEVLAYLIRDRGTLSVDDLRALDEDAQLEAVLAEAQRAGALPEGLDQEAAKDLLRLVRTHLVGFYSYEPAVYDGRLTFFRAQQRTPWDPAYPEQPWVDLASGGIEIHIVPGDHITMHHPPHLDELSAQLRRALAATEG